MKLLQVFTLVFITLLMSCKTTMPIVGAYDAYPVYTGTDLGLTWSPEKSSFKLWSAPAEEARILFYADGQVGSPLKTAKKKKERKKKKNQRKKRKKKKNMLRYKVKLKKKKKKKGIKQ